MKNITLSLLLIGILPFLSKAQKMSYHLDVIKVVHNQDSTDSDFSMLEQGAFKKSSGLINLWEKENEDVISMDLLVTEEGVGRDKYLVFQAKYYLIKNNGKPRLVATSPRHRFDKIYENNNRFEYFDPNNNEKLAIVFRLNVSAD
jgi:hypothetical protein